MYTIAGPRINESSLPRRPWDQERESASLFLIRTVCASCRILYHPSQHQPRKGASSGCKNVISDFIGLRCQLLYCSLTLISQPVNNFSELLCCIPLSHLCNLFCLFFCQGHKNKAVRWSARPFFLSSKLSRGDHNLPPAPCDRSSLSQQSRMYVFLDLCSPQALRLQIYFTDVF